MNQRTTSFCLVAWCLLQAANTHAQVDESALPVQIERAFPSLKFNRPIVLTHAGDGSDRVFIASQLGVIHVLPNDQQAATTKTFLDMSKLVVYKDKENEEGLLGLAFHPKFKQNGQFFVFYTRVSAPHTSLLSRFRISREDPNRADLNSEEQLLWFSKPYWNHNGGTVVFGPDGYLYVALGDGGSANDPHNNGQNYGVLLASILRIDVDHKDPGKNYAIPRDNPFVRSPGMRGEIWAKGLRNVWRMSFDRQTGVLWAADVGQDKWEEIDLIVRGGNYGWSLCEAKHPFKDKSDRPRPGMIDPIWEYPHEVGKSITGGHVYRGRRVPALQGLYLYADYVTGKVWGLRYDAGRQKVVANHPIAGNSMPIMSFGEDQSGEVYFMTDVGLIHRFAPTPTATAPSK